jgi:hypothetical protein
MISKINQFLDILSEFFARRKGLLPLIGIGFVIINWILQLMILEGWVVETDLLLHLGIIIVTLGFMLAWAL